MPAPAALTGEVIHRSLDTILNALVEAGCTETNQPAAVETLRSLGGYSNVLRAAADEVLRDLEPNPRAASRLAQYRRHLSQRLPEMRRQTQALVARADLSLTTTTATLERTHPESSPSPGALADGTYAELNVFSHRLRFAGRMDLVQVTSGRVRIIDFKTGAPDPHHLDQLRAYEVLWEHRDGSDMAQIHVDRLSIAYADRDVTHDPLPADALVDATHALDERISSAAAAVGNDDPEARPSAERCSFCQVRHLCDPYWSWQLDQPAGEGLTDVTVEIVGINGPKSWTYRSRHEEGVLRADEGNDFRAGVQLRLLAAFRRRSHDDQPAIISVTTVTETFALRDPS